MSRFPNTAEETTMNANTKAGRRVRRPLARLCASSVLGLGLFFSSTVSAQWIVYDPTNWFENMTTRIENAMEWSANATRWTEQLQRYSDALVTIQGMVNSFGLPAGAPLVKVPENYMVAETCGGADLSLTGLFKTFVYQPAGDWKAQQRQICVNIRTMRNRQFNESIDFIGGTMAQVQAALDAITTLRNGSRLLGNMTAVDSDTTRTANDISAKVAEWETRMKAYDAYISVMEQNQKAIAAGALKGSTGGANGLIRDVVKTAALKTALSID